LNPQKLTVLRDTVQEPSREVDPRESRTIRWRESRMGKGLSDMQLETTIS